jgi:serine/threonine-protein kinase
VRTQVNDWIGQEVADGRYKILGRIGQGSMGHIYCAHDRHLETDVVLKFPIADEQASLDQGFLDRFGREVRSLVTLSHPHIVKIIDVGEFRGLPYVVMQYLAGGSLKDRMTGPGGELRPLPPSSLRDWLLDIARALDFVHSQGHIHRDVKPANILFERHGNAFLGDFGIIKTLTSDSSDWQGNSLTAPGFLIGTPNYVAPEIVMGRPFDGRADQYSLAMTVYEALTGSNCMEGPTPSATVVNQMMVVPPSLAELLPGLPVRISDAIVRGLSKDAGERFGTCEDLAREVLAGVPADSDTNSEALEGVSSRGEPGKVLCPSCGASIPAGREHAGVRIRCPRCRALVQVLVLSPTTLLLKLVEQHLAPTVVGTPIVVHAPDGEPEPDPSAATDLVLRPVSDIKTSPVAEAPGRRYASPVPTRRLALSLLGVSVLVGVAALARGYFGSSTQSRSGGRSDILGGSANREAASDIPVKPHQPVAQVEIHIAYGTEKQRWLEAATEEFRKTPAGRRVEIRLHGMGSLEGAQAVLDGPSPVPIHVWSPASSAYRDLFEKRWLEKHQKRPILKSENLALTPMVFVMWEGRHRPFLEKYRAVSFRSVGKAMLEHSGWEVIAGEPGWGSFKFSHTHPGRSNSGLLTLVLMASEFARKDRNLSLADIADPDFLQWLEPFERSVVRTGGSLAHSTGTLMREMVLRGPSQYDCLLVYENLAIDYLEAAREHWGELRVDYPEPNVWNEHPYYVLDVPWSSSEQKAAAAEYLAFLMSRPIQQRALEHGFRPGNPEVSVRNPESPLVRHARQGLRPDLPRMCEPPRADVVEGLLQTFRRFE